MRKMKLTLSMSGLNKLFILTAVLTLVCLGGIAHASFVNYTVSGWGPYSYPAPTTPPAGAPWGPNGYPGDTLELLTYTDSLNLTPGTYVQKINTLQWTINYTYGGTATDPKAWSDLSFAVRAIRNISFDGGPNGSLSQDGLLRATWDNDYLSFSNGPITTVYVPGYKIDITPLVFLVEGSFSGSSPWAQPTIDVMARFDVTSAPAPIPGAVWLLGSGILGLLAFRKILSA